MVKISPIGDIEHLFAFDSIMRLVLTWSGEQKQRTDRAFLRLIPTNRNKCVPAYSRDAQKVLTVLQCQKVFSVVEFEQKLRAR